MRTGSDAPLRGAVTPSSVAFTLSDRRLDEGLRSRLLHTTIRFDANRTDRAKVRQWNRKKPHARRTGFADREHRAIDRTVRTRAPGTDCRSTEKAGTDSVAADASSSGANNTEATCASTGGASGASRRDTRATCGSRGSSQEDAWRTVPGREPRSPRLQGLGWHGSREASSQECGLTSAKRLKVVSIL